MPTAAAIIIGNEILSGKFADENGPYFIRRLRTLGCDLKRLVVVPDDVDEIATELRACAARYDHVFTSGGVGPTHDDVTIEAVGRAFGVSLEPRDELLALLDRYGLPRNDGTMRMVTVPQGTELIAHESLSYPVLHVRNVYVLPGVPKLLRNKFEAIASRFAGVEVQSDRLYTDEQEWDIADRLTAVAVKYPTVDIGSYPRFGEGPFHVIITLESRDRAALDRAKSELLAMLSTVSPTATRER